MAIEVSKQEFEKMFGRPPVLGGAQTPTTKEPGYLSRVGSQMKGQLSEAYQSEKAFASKPDGTLGEGLAAGANIAKNLSGAALAPIAQLPGLRQVGEALGKAGEAIVDTKLGNKGTNFLANKFSPETLGTASDVAETGLNVAGLYGAKTLATKAKPVASKAIQTVKPAIAGTGRALKASGEGSYGITTTLGEGTARALQTYKESTPTLASRIKNTVTGQTKGKPTTEANTAARYGLMGTEQEIGVQAGRYMKSIWADKVSPALSQSKGVLDMKKFFDVVEKKIIKDTPELTRRNDLVEGLTALKSEFGKVNKVKLPKLQAYKEGWANTLPEASWKGKPIASALKEVKKVASDTAREFILKNTPDEVKQHYIDYGNLKSIREAGIKSGVGDLAKKSIGRGVWQFIMDKAVTPIATIGGKILYRTGEGLEFIGESGAKTVGDIVGTSKGNPPMTLPTQKQ